MATTTNVPLIQWESSGIVIPQETDILSGVQADINNAFGGGLNPGLSTPQGQLASSQAAVIADKNSQIAYITNQVDPQYAQSRFQDAIGRLYFMTRNPATPTAVSVTLTGIPGTLVPEGAIAQDTSGNTYANSGDVTISSAGTVSAIFNNTANGPIGCPAGTLTQIVQSISGWDAITNTTDGALGSNVESRQAFEFRRKNSVAANAHGSPQAIYGAVFGCAGVLDCFVVDNPSGNIVNYGSTNYPLAPHSVFVSVLGGASSDIAQAIWSKKDCGCDTNGNCQVTVIDPSGYSYPPPSYLINFVQPTALSIYFAVNIVNDPSLPSDIVSLIQAAVVAQFSGENGSQRERIGSTVHASKYYGPVALAASNIQINSILIGTAPNPSGVIVPVGIDQYPNISTANIAVNLQ